jgi:23S rRNA (cytidine1920-2'-O)/16S rRNA (cytidine1409-2'-O)-methyltransferase
MSKNKKSLSKKSQLEVDVTDSEDYSGVPKPSAKQKQRADVWLVERNLAETREKAKALIMAGQVLAGTQRIDKPGDMLDTAKAATLNLKAGAALAYVSRGGLKLERALDTFQVDPTGKVALDIGASTGGFTDCLLQRGAVMVWAVDVGHNQLDWKILQDPRVLVLDKTNIRYLENLPPLPEAGGGATLAQIVVIDVSFISLKLVLPAARRLSEIGAPIVTLVKPQFEAGREQVGKGGIIRDPAVHRQVLENLVNWCNANSFEVHGLTSSPILGTEGNAEFLALLQASPSEISPEQANAALALIPPLFELELSEDASQSTT